MCVFCKIINKEFSSMIVYEDEIVMAILDLSQQTKGHTLVMPKKHYENILEVDSNTLSHMMNIVKMLCNDYLSKLGCNGFNIVNNCNPVAGQTVMHLHIHIIPRYEDDDSKLVFINNASLSNVSDASNKDKYNLLDILNLLK